MNEQGLYGDLRDLMDKMGPRPGPREDGLGEQGWLARWRELCALMDEASHGIRSAFLAGNPRKAATLYLERAHVEMCLRDHCGQDAARPHLPHLAAVDGRFQFYEDFMREDIESAQRLVSA